MNDLPHLVTPRLELRLLTPQDYPRWQQSIIRLPQPVSSWDMAPPGDAGEEAFAARCAANIKAFHEGSDVRLDIIHRKDDLYIGGVSLMDISRGVFQNAYIGYNIVPMYRKRRYAYEACVAALGYAFGPQGLHRVEAGIHPDNEPSIRLAKRLGLRYEGLSLRRLFLGGQWLDMSLWAMTAEEWTG
jgi:ribosomal-protein-alanine N-acetyltransferase